MVQFRRIDLSVYLFCATVMICLLVSCKSNMEYRSFSSEVDKMAAIYNFNYRSFLSDHLPVYREPLWSLNTHKDAMEGRPLHTPENWKMHIIDNTSFGADGTKLGDANKDGFPDIVTGWEQGEEARLYFNPGTKKADSPWPFVAVHAPGSEDAFLVDLDGDGSQDIVTLSEDNNDRITFHWAPTDFDQYQKSAYWKSEDVPVSLGRKWMFGVPMDIDHKNGIDLVVGSKGENGTLGWLESPKDPKRIVEWQYHEISLAGWIMSIRKTDLDQDGLEDILISDRKGPDRGVRWLQNPGNREQWQNHMIGLNDGEPMFLDLVDLNDDGLDDIIVPDLIQGFVVFTQKPDHTWQRINIPFPQSSGTRGKCVAVGDIDNDGQLDVVSSYEGAEGKEGVMWTSGLLSQHRKDHNVSGAAGIKFDLVKLIDMDGDGDLDILTSEENNNSSTVAGLGVIWYENPTK